MTFTRWLLGMFLRLAPKGMLTGKRPAVVIWPQAARLKSQMVAVLHSYVFKSRQGELEPPVKRYQGAFYR